VRARDQRSAARVPIDDAAAAAEAREVNRGHQASGAAPYDQRIDLHD